MAEFLADFAEDSEAPEDLCAGPETFEPATSDGWESCEEIDADLYLPEIADALGTVSHFNQRMRRRGERMRLGPVAVPLGVIAWTGSLLLHGGIVGGAVLIATMVGLQLPPQIAFSRGDGSAEVGFRNDGTGLEAVAMPLMPFTASNEVEASSAMNEASLEDEAQDVAFESSDNVPPPTLGDATAAATEDPLIGIAPAAGIPTSRFHTAGPPMASAPVTESAEASKPAGESNARSNSPVVLAKTDALPGDGGIPSHRGKPGVANGIDARGIAVPVYPIESLRKREQGVVILSVEIDAKGTVLAIDVVQDPGYPRLVRAAIEAVKATPFPAATDDGEAIASMARIPFRFSIR